MDGSYIPGAIRTDGTLWGWGGNYTGKQNVNASSPIQIGTSTGWVDVVTYNGVGIAVQLS